MIKNYIKLAWKVMLRKRLYTGISLFGISITLMFVIVISAFVNHLGSNTTPRSHFDRVLSLTFVDHYKLNEEDQRVSNSTSPPSYDLIKRYMKTMVTPKMVSAISFQPYFVDVYRNKIKSRLILRYVDSEFWQITDFNFVDGRSFNSVEFDNGSKVAVIDKETADLMYEGDAIGKDISVNGKSYKICGVLNGVGITRLRLSGDIFVPITTEPSFLARKITGEFSALVMAKSKKDFDKIREEFQTVIPKVDLTVEDEGRDHLYGALDSGVLSAMRSIFRISKLKLQRIIFLVIGTILLLYLALPSINLLNINVNRIYERSTEIGSRKAFGATSKQIIGQFITENIFLTLIGGAIGLILAFIALHLLNDQQFLEGSKLIIDFKTFGFAIMVTLLLGLLSGTLPAWRMSRIKIVNALKKEEQA